MEQTDRFQPMSLVNQLKRYMKEAKNNPAMSNEVTQGVCMGLAWAIAEIMAQATAKDRYTP